MSNLQARDISRAGCKIVININKEMNCGCRCLTFIQGVTKRMKHAFNFLPVGDWQCTLQKCIK